MIDGMKIDIAEGELNAALRNRAAYLVKRAETKRAEIPALEKIMEDVKAGRQSNMGYSGNVDPVQTLRDQIDGHVKKAAEYVYIADHLVKGETYRLNVHELQQYELVITK